MNSKYIGWLVFIVLLLLVVLLNRGSISLTGQDSFVLQPLSSTGYVLQSEIHLNNPNLLSGTVKSIHEEFRLNGVLLGVLDQEINQGIPGRKESGFPVSIRFAKEDYDRAIRRDSSTAAKPAIKVEGNIVYSNLISGGEIRVNQVSEVRF